MPPPATSRVPLSRVFQLPAEVSPWTSSKWGRAPTLRVATVMAPPMASAPKRAEAAPRRMSMRSACSGFTCFRSLRGVGKPSTKTAMPRTPRMVRVPPLSSSPTLERSSSTRSAGRSRSMSAAVMTVRLVSSPSAAALKGSQHTPVARSTVSAFTR